MGRHVNQVNGLLCGLRSAAAPFLWPLGRIRGTSAVRDRRNLYWAIVYVNDEGQMVTTTAKLLGFYPEVRVLTVLCHATGRQKALKISKIVRVKDLHKGLTIDVPEWLKEFGGALTARR